MWSPPNVKSRLCLYLWVFIAAFLPLSCSSLIKSMVLNKAIYGLIDAWFILFFSLCLCGDEEWALLELAKDRALDSTLPLVLPCCWPDLYVNSFIKIVWFGLYYRVWEILGVPPTWFICFCLGEFRPDNWSGDETLSSRFLECLFVALMYWSSLRLFTTMFGQ